MDRNDPYYVFVNLMSRFAYETNDSADHNITITLLKRLHDLSLPLSLKDLANEANVSEATVSRYVRKLYFNDYQDFRQKFIPSIYAAKIARASLFTEPPQKLCNDLVDSQINDLNSLRVTLNMRKVNSFLDDVLSHGSMIIIGGASLITSLYNFRIDLNASGIPCYFFYPVPTQVELLQKAGKSTVIFYVVANDSYLEYYSNNISQLHKKGIPQYLLTSGKSIGKKSEFAGVFRLTCTSRIGPANLYRTFSEILSSSLFELINSKNR